jgi:hypothetical protein
MRKRKDTNTHQKTRSEHTSNPEHPTKPEKKPQMTEAVEPSKTSTQERPTAEDLMRDEARTQPQGEWQEEIQINQIHAHPTTQSQETKHCVHRGPQAAREPPEDIKEEDPTAKDEAETTELDPPPIKLQKRGRKCQEQAQNSCNNRKKTPENRATSTTT